MSNPEYADLPFVRPRAWGKGRDGRAVQVIVVHYTAGSERSTSAEDGAAYDQRRTDGTSTHYFVDQNSVVQCVETWNRANAALYNGNRIGIQYELCGTVQTRAQWLDAASEPTLRNAARQIARDCRKYGIPVRKLTSGEVRAGAKGICGHVDITYAFPQDKGTHTDPGTAFPWDVLLAYVNEAMGNAGTPVVLPAPAGPPWPGRVFRLRSPRMTGSDIRQWQQRMRDRGWRIGVDGSYGPESEGVCRKFQAEKRLGVDGEVGPITWGAAWTAPVT